VCCCYVIYPEPQRAYRVNWTSVAINVWSPAPHPSHILRLSKSSCSYRGDFAGRQAPTLPYLHVLNTGFKGSYWENNQETRRTVSRRNWSSIHLTGIRHSFCSHRAAHGCGHHMPSCSGLRITPEGYKDYVLWCRVVWSIFTCVSVELALAFFRCRRGRSVLRNVGKYLPDYTASSPRKH
jgi:hypothetical protein